MPLYKRKDSPVWWLKISHNGKRIQKSTGTTDRAKAQEYHDKLKATLWDEARLGVKPRHTWNEAVLRWLQETAHKATHEDDKAHLRWVDKFLDGVFLDDIDRELVDAISADRLSGGVSNATVNRTLEVVRAIMRRAALEWEWLDRVPRFRMLPEPKRRIRFLTRIEADKLVAELPAHLAAMARFTLETGLRQRNVTRLEWAQVDIVSRQAWIHPDQAKARRAIPVPLTPVAVSILRQHMGRHERFVFTYKGRPIGQPNNWAWRKALIRAGIEDFRWHDLRHTWASWHVQAGTPLHVLQELGGWESVEMVRRYAHLSSEHLRAYVDKASAVIRVVEELPSPKQGGKG